MEDTKKLFKEYKNRNEALSDIREMKASGVEEIKTCELNAQTRPPTDVGVPPIEKHKAYALQGTLVGAFSGMLVGLIVFWIPALILRFSHAGVAGIVGTAVSSLFGALLGWGESFAQAKRKTEEPSSSTGDHTLGVEVYPENAQQRLIARKIMTLDSSRI